MSNHRSDNRYIVDAWAWVEYFGGTLLGIEVKKYVENENNVIFTSVISVAEIVSKFIRKSISPEDAVNGIINLSKLLYVDDEIAILAGRLHAKIKTRIKDFGLSDAFILAASRKENAKIITGDPHFKNFRETLLISR